MARYCLLAVLLLSLEGADDPLPGAGGREGFESHRSSLIMQTFLVVAIFGTTRNTLGNRRPARCWATAGHRQPS